MQFSPTLVFVLTNRVHKLLSKLFEFLVANSVYLEELTVGGLITGMMFLLTAFGSLAMIVMWVLRFAQTGHALPAARRGVLRVPLALTIVAISLSVLLMVLVLLSAIGLKMLSDARRAAAEDDPRPVPRWGRGDCCKCCFGWPYPAVCSP